MPDFDSRTHTASCVNGVWTVTPRDLTLVKAEAKARIDHDAEQARLKYITAGSGQAREYALVVEDLERYATRVSANLDPLVENGVAIAYPALQASVTAGEAENIPAAYAFISAREGASTTKLIQIRTMRIAAKLAISAATTIDQVSAATQVTWP